MTTMTNVARKLKHKICNDGRFCDDVLLIGLAGVVFWMMALSIGQITI